MEMSALFLFLVSLVVLGLAQTTPDCSLVRCAPIPVGCVRKQGTCCDFVCPKNCTTNSQCDRGSFCKKTSCSPTASGVCQVRNRACVQNFAPVCGCDGKTYSNACSAGASAASVRHTGNCKTKQPPTTKQCTTNSQCGQDSYCKKTSCSQTAAGVCQMKSTICTLKFAPVCGCDGKTYGNACGAASSGVSVQSVGECKTGQPTTTQCTTNSQCGRDSYCKKTSCSQTASGVCQVKSEVCTAQFDPVCGCDGKTYGNACGASSSGVSVQSVGECKTEQPTTTRSSQATLETALAVSDQASESTAGDKDFPPYAIALIVIGSLLLIAVVTLVVLVFAVKAKMFKFAERN